MSHGFDLEIEKGVLVLLSFTDRKFRGSSEANEVSEIEIEIETWVIGPM